VSEWVQPGRRRKRAQRAGGSEAGAGSASAPRAQAGSPEAPIDPAEAEAQEALAQVPDYSYADDDPFHGKITAEIIAKVEEMFRLAREDPKSDANLMVRIMLLNQVARIEAERYRQDPKLVLTEERRRGFEHVRQLEKDRLLAGGVKVRNKKVEADIRLTLAKVADLELLIEDHRRQLSDALRVAENAKAAAENGQPLEPLAVYNRIAEIVGLRAPRDQEKQNV